MPGRRATSRDVVARRLRAQRLIGAPAATPAEIVAWLGAVQAQDYRGALWGVAQRCGATEADVERALAERTIVRTWPMRGTLHFVAAADVRWWTALLAPRVIQRAASRHRQLALDATVFARARRILEAALAGTTLTRAELYAALERGGVACAEQRDIHVIAQLAMECFLCFGAPRGKQQTFTLLDDWIPTSRALAGDDALAELAARYYASHGPATVDDLAWWSGLAIGEARRATALVAGLPTLELAGRTYVGGGAAARVAGTVHLLPAYDEYTVGYRDRSAIVGGAHATATLNALTAVVLVDGRVAGTWRRAARGRSIDVHVAVTGRPDRRALARAVECYGAFADQPASLTVTPTLPPQPRAAAATARQAASRGRRAGARRDSPRRRATARPPRR